MNTILNPPRVRFAPSPTGHLHIGGLRGALFNWVFAKKYGGQFLLRIEDTDFQRSKQEYTDSIVRAFEWCGIESDESLVFQSQRMDLYKIYIDRLIDSGKGYWSDEPDESGVIGRVLKYRVSREREYIQFHDIIKGEVSFSVNEIEDFIVVRSDGTPLYNFVVVVDDIEMKISHIIRGEEHLSNAPRQILLYEAFGIKPPCFAHLPLILGPDGKKLSKRDAATAVIDYKNMGFLPHALCNYLMRLGWAHGDQEIFSVDELIRYFDLKDINSSGAMFDMQKLFWVNGVYIKKTDASDLLEMLYSSEIIETSSFCKKWNREQVVACIRMHQDRITTLVELASACQLLCDGPSCYEMNSVEYSEEIKPGNAFIQLLIDVLSDPLFVLSDESIKHACKNLAAQNKVPLSVILKVMRFAITASFSSPSLYAIVLLLGKEESIKRINAYSTSLNCQ